jgi:hypothetical protein
VEHRVLIEQRVQGRKIAITQDTVPAGNRMIVTQAHGPKPSVSMTRLPAMTDDARGGWC